MLLTREIIDEYIEKNREIEKINSKIDYYTSKVPRSEYGVVKGSMSEHPYAEKHFVLSGSDIKDNQETQDKTRQLLITLSERKKECENMSFEIEKAIALRTDDIGAILFGRYIAKKTDKEIAEELGYERSTITKKINAYFREQEELLS